MKSFIQSKTGTGFDPTKVKATFRMCVTRINMQRNKLANSVKVQRRSIAELLAMEKYDSARIRVENCIREDIHIEGYEVLMLFIDLLSNRVQLIAESKPLKTAGKKDPCSACPPELKEAITSVLWASARVSDVVPELATIRKAFESKFGKEFVDMSVSNAEYSVNQKMMERLGMYTPPSEKCIAYLTNIALEYKLENFDEAKLRDPNGLVPTTGIPDMVPGAGELAKKGTDTIVTPSGMYIPRIRRANDALDQRLLRLERF